MKFPNIVNLIKRKDKSSEPTQTLEEKLAADNETIFSSSKIAYDGNRFPNPRVIGYTDIFLIDGFGNAPVNLTKNYHGGMRPAWSPDGKKIAFDYHVDGNWDIYVMNADGTGIGKLTDGPSKDIHPVWSSDGKRIAFSSNRGTYNQTVFVMNADGTGIQRLLDNEARAFPSSWSPDGSKMLIESDYGYPCQIYLVNSDGSDLKSLTRVNMPRPEFREVMDEWRNTYCDFEPKYSPDGSRIAFTSSRGGFNALYVMNSDGTDAVRLTELTSIFHSPTWSPDGSKVAFISWSNLLQDPKPYDMPKTESIYIMDADGTNIRRLNVGAGILRCAWSPFLE